MNPKENYLHEFFRIFFANKQWVKRVFLIFAVIVLVLPLVLKQSFDITAQVIVQSKKLSQGDATTSLTVDNATFIPPSLADMETESNILRSPALIRQTISELRDKGEYTPNPGVFYTWVAQPFRRFVTTPLREYVINPLRKALGLETDPVRDTALDTLTQQAMDSLKIETLPGSNVISIIYSFGNPAQGTKFVSKLLQNYLASRQELQSIELPQSFYETKKHQYEVRLDGLEGNRLALLESISSSDPKEEITFRLNAINTEEQALNLYQDRLLQSQRWLEYLKTALANATNNKLSDYTFPYTFTTTVDNVAFEDREIKQLGEQLTTQVTRYNNDLAVFQPGSEPMLLTREQISRTRQQFLKIVSNRIQERTNDLAIVSSVIDQKTARIATFKNRIHQLQETQSKLRQMDTEIDALHAAFSTYAQRFAESSATRSLDNDLSNARVLSPPYEPTDPAFPKPLLIIPFGLFTGLLLAIALVYVREFFDHRFKHPAQLTHELGLPVLLVINDQNALPTNPHPNWSVPSFVHWVRN
ncbi:MULTISPECIES: GumC family protein [unclassified Pseudomonas]|uniref:GumC family protein n=1 Tax=unclassified Pseudomonas TaxID=196821 RepID=UPI002AC9B1D2|nr:MULTISPECIES: Wzz/FepE/Etk N-terminal domain-containing protein [unclassified Pseudomonas]MEB0048300.1 Wzz/FepE/Etk N-terminal domain-containing protein [Pseudomonas sp. Dout3]MEB0099050.1 Wzz/FepE/Etk N-terminal domain-containing protein [Pseudomonas sp. DC1.2]WPX56950.1 Wzz/FepE/Etk N-terminal domain-containing protein [Pseudomonas sp. DC1.2]